MKTQHLDDSVCPGDAYALSTQANIHLDRTSEIHSIRSSNATLFLDGKDIYIYNSDIITQTSTTKSTPPTCTLSVDAKLVRVFHAQ